MMGYFDYECDDMFEENEYEEKVEELKNAVRESVKSEILEEMNRLREENDQLKEVKEHFEEIDRKYKSKMAECDRAIGAAKEEAKLMRLSELMESHKIIKYGIKVEQGYGPKCGKCNSCRDIKVNLPSGRTAMDTCECAREKRTIYLPNKYKLYNFRKSDGKVLAWYKEYKGELGGESTFELTKVLDDLSAKRKEQAIKSKNYELSKVLFDSEEECKQVCDSLNAGVDMETFKYDLYGYLLGND